MPAGKQTRALAALRTLFQGNVAGIVREGGGFLREDGGVGRAGVEPAAVCLRTPMAGIVSVMVGQAPKVRPAGPASATR
jgi:hypothetical protein